MKSSLIFLVGIVFLFFATQLLQRNQTQVMDQYELYELIQAYNQDPSSINELKFTEHNGIYKVQIEYTS